MKDGDSPLRILPPEWQSPSFQGLAVELKKQTIIAQCSGIIKARNASEPREYAFTLGLDRYIRVLQESKMDEDRARRLSTSLKEGGGQSSTVQGESWELQTQIWVQSSVFPLIVPSQVSDFWLSKETISKMGIIPTYSCHCTHSSHIPHRWEKVDELIHAKHLHSAWHLGIHEVRILCVEDMHGRVGSWWASAGKISWGITEINLRKKMQPSDWKKRLTTSELNQRVY